MNSILQCLTYLHPLHPQAVTGLLASPIYTAIVHQRHIVSAHCRDKGSIGFPSQILKYTLKANGANLKAMYGHVDKGYHVENLSKKCPDFI